MINLIPTDKTFTLIIPNLLQHRDSDQNHKAAMKRKREKLDHLSEEEKLLRRKIKNRISAQTARDRKKAKLHELEIQVEQLIKANSLLSKRNQELEEENANLKSQFSCNSIGNSSPSLFGEQSKCDSLESAAFINGSQPKNQESHLASSPAWTRILIFLSMAMTAMISSSGYTNVPKTFWKQIHSSPPR